MLTPATLIGGEPTTHDPARAVSPPQTAADEATGQRERILDAAFALMADRGASGTSMRQLAAACGVNVATLYHYFPSKAELLRSVIEERQYDVLLAEPPLPDASLPPRERLAALVMMMWEGSLEEERIWQLLLAEASHGDATAVAVGRDLLATIQSAVAAWLPELFPELVVDAAVAARLVTGQLYTLVVESLFFPSDERAANAQRRADDAAALLFP